MRGWSYFGRPSTKKAIEANKDKTICFIVDEHNHMCMRRAQDPERYLERMQVSNADTLRIVATELEVGDRRQELYRRFQHLHIGSGWFRGEPELWEYVNGLGEYVGNYGYRLRLGLRGVTFHPSTHRLKC